jgi:DNA-binding NtrC family response regulator
MSEAAAYEFRWQAFFQNTALPLFLLNRRRRILFVNRAWESCTGLALRDVRGRVCRRRSASAGLEKEEAILSACAPPADALGGRACQARRRAPGSGNWWEIQFLPLGSPPPGEGVGTRGEAEAPTRERGSQFAGGGILGTIRVLAAPADVPLAIPEKLMALRDRQTTRYRLDDDGAAPLSATMRRVHEQARLAAQTRLPIMLLGEAGAGKQWLARAIHFLARQTDAPLSNFACLDAERLPAALVEEFLFGKNVDFRSQISDDWRTPATTLQSEICNLKSHAFGTIYLREPAHLPREIQSRLAETLSMQYRLQGEAPTRERGSQLEGTSENPGLPRLIVGFRLDPRIAVQAGRLLEELYYAVSTITITIPPLRERLGELPRFIEIFLQRTRELQVHAVHGVSGEAMNALRGHGWPDNLRELQEILSNACRRAKTERIELGDLSYYLKQAALPPERRLPLDKLLEEVERRLIALALKLTQNNQTRAAELLEIWRPRLVRRMEKFGLGE